MLSHIIRMSLIIQHLFVLNHETPAKRLLARVSFISSSLVLSITSQPLPKNTSLAARASQTCPNLEFATQQLHASGYKLEYYEILLTWNQALLGYIVCYILIYNYWESFQSYYAMELLGISSDSWHPFLPWDHNASDPLLPFPTRNVKW